MRHQFEQRSVVPWEELATTAMEHSMGTASPDDIVREVLRQGVIMRMKDGTAPVHHGGAATRGGRDCRLCRRRAAARSGPSARPTGLDRTLSDGKVLNDGQWEAVTGLLNSPNRVNMVQGPAGAGKSYLLAQIRRRRAADGAARHLSRPPRRRRSRCWRRTASRPARVARFLLDKEMQAAARGGRVVIDETSMLGHKDAVRLFDIAKRDDLKLIFVGDPMQHGSVPRGALMRLLTEYAGVKPFRLTRDHAAGRSRPTGRRPRCFPRARRWKASTPWTRMGWVKELGDEERYAAIAADYLQALNDKKSVLVVSPTHEEAAHHHGGDPRQAPRGGQARHRGAGIHPAGAGQCLRSRAGPGGDLPAGRRASVPPERQGASPKASGSPSPIRPAVPLAEAAKFSLYRPENIALAAGDVIRFTGTVKTMDGKHTLKNGAVEDRRRLHRRRQHPAGQRLGGRQRCRAFPLGLRGNLASAARAAPCSG